MSDAQDPDREDETERRRALLARIPGYDVERDPFADLEEAS